MKQYKKIIDSGSQKKKKNRFWQAAAEVLRFPRENACPDEKRRWLCSYEQLSDLDTPQALYSHVNAM